MANRTSLLGADDWRTLLPVSPRGDEAGSGQPDLIVLDLLMPRTTPLAVCRVLQSPGDTRPIPINLLTTGVRRAAGVVRHHRSDT